MAAKTCRLLPAIQQLSWCCLIALLACRVPEALAKDRMLYWNISNPLFKASGGVSSYLVPKNDRLVIVCPSNGLEFYRLYWTHSEAAAAACQAADNRVFQLLQCASPADSGAILVTDFSPIPGAPTFDRTVHVFTPSSGSRAGLDQLQGGSCQTRNMRLNVDIGDPDTMTQPAVQPPATTAAGHSSSTSAAAAATTDGDRPADGDRGGGRGTDSATSAADGPSGRLPPTAQDLARHAQTNVIVGAASLLPSAALVIAATILGSTIISLRLPVLW